MQVIKDMLGSKKAVTALVAFLAAIAAKLGFNLDTEAIIAITAPLIAYIIGQGVADHGKEAAQVTAEAGVKMANTVTTGVPENPTPTPTQSGPLVSSPAA